MVLRTAKTGRRAGQQFYGCSGYPRCKKTININEIPGEFQEKHHDQEIPEIVARLLENNSENKFEKPQVVECQPINPSYQVRIFENVWTLPKIVPQLNRKRKKLNKDHLTAFAQWRLDFPASKEQIDSDIYNPLSVLEKILLRGSLIPCPPQVYDQFKDQINDSTERTEKFIDLLQKVDQHPRSFLKQSQFGSDSEEFFYSEVVSRYENPNKILPWVFPQASFSNLTQNSINPGSNQKVDFLFSHPKIDNFIVEIDGPQHEDSEEADNRRDALLNQFGYKVFRIKTSDQDEHNFTIDESLENHFQEFKKFEIIDLKNNSDLEILLLVKVSYQIQIALLETIKGGWFDLNSKSPWKIEVVPPYWVSDIERFIKVVEISVNDFITTIQKILNLFSIQRNEINFILIEPGKKKVPDIIISLNSSSKRNSQQAPIFFISDTYLPIKISQTIPSSEPSYIRKPLKEIVQYFLKYIFQKRDFLEGQWEAIERTLQGKDSIVLLPTGGGKTIAFQLASFLLPGITLVIDPLIALINDQVANLREYGINRTVGITSQLNLDERITALESF